MARRKPSKVKVRRDRRARYVPRRKFCFFCTDNIEVIDYKDTERLSHYISGRGEIEPRHKTGTCAKHQRALAVAIKKARYLALLPYVPTHIYKMGLSTGG